MNRVICLLVTAALAFTSCSTICRKPTETVLINSNPQGAKVIVDGKELGVTPSYVKLNPRKSHRILLEKEGWCREEYMIKSKISAVRLGSNIFLPITALIAAGGFGLYAAGGTTSGFAGMAVVVCLAGGVAVGTAALLVGMGVDLYTGNAKNLDRKELNVQLVPLR